MSAIERCRTAALGGHVARCENDGCGHTLIAYNSCRNRHCPKCQGAATREWLAEREAELLPVPYFHVVYTSGADRRSRLHQRSLASVPPARRQDAAHGSRVRQARVLGAHAGLAEAASLRSIPRATEEMRMGGLRQATVRRSEQVLAYLSRYTHRIAISDRRLVSADASMVCSNTKTYRVDGPERFKVMTLATGGSSAASSRTCPPKGLPRIRHYGLLASSQRADNVARLGGCCRGRPAVEPGRKAAARMPSRPPRVRPCCGARMFVIEVSRTRHHGTSRRRSS